MQAQIISEAKAPGSVFSQPQGEYAPAQHAKRIYILSQASLTYHKNNLRHFGDHVMLFNGKVEGFMGRNRLIKSLISMRKYRLLMSFTTWEPLRTSTLLLGQCLSSKGTYLHTKGQL